MANVLESIRAKAKSLGRKVCLTESDDPRNLKAAEKLASEAPVKILFPVALLIFPAVFTVVIAPMLMRALEMFR